MSKKTYSARFKFQVVLEAIQSPKRTNAEIARAYEVHPAGALELEEAVYGGGSKSVRLGRRAQAPAREDCQAPGRLVGQKEIEIALLKSFFGRELTISEKARIVSEHKGEYSLNRCLEATGLAKSTWYYRRRRKQEDLSEEEKLIVQTIREIITEHPAYGYRRILPELRERTGLRVNHKRLRRLLNEHDLGLMRCLPASKPSAARQTLFECKGQLNLVNGRAFGPLEAFSTDFTEPPYASGKAQLMALVDIESKWVAGWAVGPSANRELALRCWQHAKERLAGLGAGPAGLIVHHDQDSVYTSYDWLRALLIEDGARVSYSENGAKGNPWTQDRSGAASKPRTDP